MNYKSIFNKLSKISNINCAINIILVIGKIRPAFWYDCWDLDKDKMNKLLLYLDTFNKYGIKYKFDNDTYKKSNKSKDEGPLIYNVKMLNKKNIKIIESTDLKKIYSNKLFGEILGYSCPLNVLRIKRENYCSIDFYLKFKKNSLYITKQIYGFYCSSSNIKNIINDINNKALKMNKLIKKINNNYTITLSISY